MKKFVKIIASTLLVGALLTGCASGGAGKTGEGNGSFEPKREVEFVVPSSAGGGSDLNARIISEIAFKEGFTPKNFMVTNMPGGSGGVAFADVYSKKGNNETLMILHNGQIMSTIVNESPVTSDMLTYLPVVAFDNLLIVTRADSEYQDIEALLEAAKTPDKVKVGGSQRGNTDHLAFELMNKYAEVEASYVQFDGSGDVLGALLGGHIDAAICNPSDTLGQVQAGEVIPLAVFSQERIGKEFEDAPTFAELGYEGIEIDAVRAIAGPPEMSAEAIAFYDEVIRKVTETDQWKNEYLEPNNLEGVYMTSAEAKEFFEKEIEKYKEIFTEVGVIK
ncbi:MAG: tripartite tricarboxylate transporter substrate binding protein [Epulopiscium sp.]|nr:tripartite tricarboxylate transporter substrate binding protein [Candidatus Epulonipiscium sp.]